MSFETIYDRQKRRWKRRAFIRKHTELIMLIASIVITAAAFYIIT
jgi:hypothetical protein